MTIASLAQDLDVSPFRIVKYLMGIGTFKSINQELTLEEESEIRIASKLWPKKGYPSMGVNRIKEYL